MVEIKFSEKSHSPSVERKDDLKSTRKIELLSADSRAQFINVKQQKIQQLEPIKTQAVKELKLNSSTMLPNTATRTSLINKKHVRALLGNEFSPANQLSRDMITPEVAAYVVKEYLLPIFEN